MNGGMPWRNRLGRKYSQYVSLTKKKVSRISKQLPRSGIQGALLTIAKHYASIFSFSQVISPLTRVTARIFREVQCRRLIAKQRGGVVQEGKKNRIGGVSSAYALGLRTFMFDILQLTPPTFFLSFGLYPSMSHASQVQSHVHDLGCKDGLRATSRPG